jgi:squalene synthase HpnC
MKGRTGRGRAAFQGEDVGEPVRHRSVTERPAAALAEPDAAPHRVPAVAAKAASENFPVALRLLPRTYRQHLMAVYVFARTADDLGDEAPPAERPRLLGDLEAEVRALYESIAAAGVARVSDAVAGLRDAVVACGIPMQPFIDLIRANQQDQVVTRYETFNDLLGYCRLSANPVGQIVLHVFGSFSPARAELSDRICSGLQLAEHWQDVAEDLRAGRIYLPHADMAAYGCGENDLAAPQASPLVRELMAFEVGRARSLIDSGAPLIGTLRGAARIAVAGYVAGGRAALAAIEAANYDVLALSPRPGKTRTAAELGICLVRGR